MSADQVTMLITIAIIYTRDSGLALVSSESLKQSLNPLTIGVAASLTTAASYVQRISQLNIDFNCGINI